MGHTSSESKAIFIWTIVEASRLRILEPPGRVTPYSQGLPHRIVCRQMKNNKQKEFICH
jgi:hypothetical protein